MNLLLWRSFSAATISRDRLVVRTPRYGRGNPGSNPGHGMSLLGFLTFQFKLWSLATLDSANFSR